MPLNITNIDITKLNVDAIVNATNVGLKKRGDACGAIFLASGADKLKKACDKFAPIQPGGAVITSGFALPAKYIIHTVKPNFLSGRQKTENLLRSCYIYSLDLAKKHGCNSIALPLISGGLFSCSKNKAFAAASKTIRGWLAINDMDVSLVVTGKKASILPKKRRREIEKYIDDGRNNEIFTQVNSRDRHFGNIGRHLEKRARSVRMYSNMRSIEHSSSLEDIVGNLDEPFSTTLFRLIDAKRMTNSEVCKRANISRQQISKMRKSDYQPKKQTVAALAIALKLSLPETRDLLHRAGFVLSRCLVFDKIIEHYITMGIYDIDEINQVLWNFDQIQLGHKVREENINDEW